MKKIKNIALFLPNLLLIISCGPKDKFEWNAGISAPIYYGASGPFVEYFYKGNGVVGTSAKESLPIFNDFLSVDFPPIDHRYKYRS